MNLEELEPTKKPAPKPTAKKAATARGTAVLSVAYRRAACRKLRADGGGAHERPQGTSDTSRTHETAATHDAREDAS